MTSAAEAHPAVVQFDVDGDQVDSAAARFQVGCSTATSPCPSAPTSISQTVVTEAGTLSVTADWPWSTRTGNYDGGTFTLRIDGMAVAVVAAGAHLEGGLFRYPLAGALDVAAGPHEIRIEMNRVYIANSTTPLQHIDNVVAQIGGGQPPTQVPPVAGFSAACGGLSCGFTDQSSDADGTITAWSWNFGDGSSSILRTRATITRAPARTPSR